MNKYTLKFESPLIESMYRNDRVSSITKACFYGFSMSTAIAFLIRIIDNIISELPLKYTINSIALAGVLCLIVIAYKFNTFGIPITLLNIGLSSLQLSIEYEQYSQNNYVTGGNMMMCHAILLFNNDFIQSMITNVLLCAIRITIAMMYSPNRDYQVYFLTILITTYYGYILYKVNYYQRHSFYLSLQDNQLKNVLPFIAQDAFALFTYNENQLKFEQKSIKRLQEIVLDKENAQEQFTQFIRNSYLSKEFSLEQYIFKRTKSKNKEILQNETQLEVSFQNQKYLIKYSEFNIPKSFYLIVISPILVDICPQSIKKTKLQLLFFSKFQMFLKTIICFTQNKQDNNQLKLNKICNFCLHIYWKSQLLDNRSQFYKFNLENFIKSKLKIFNSLQKKMIIRFESSLNLQNNIMLDRITMECFMIELLFVIYQCSLRQCILKLIKFDLGILVIRIINVDDEDFRKIINQCSVLKNLMLGDVKTSFFNVTMQFKIC